MATPLSERSTTTLGVVGAVGLVLVSLVVWASTVANRVSEHDREFVADEARLAKVEQRQEEMIQANTKALGDINLAQALLSQAMQQQAIVLAEIRGSLHTANAVSLQQTPQQAPQQTPRPQRPAIGSFLR